MAFSGEKGAALTEADMQMLADEANLALTKVAMGRTQDDIRKGGDPTYVPPAWGLGDDYEFDDPSETYPHDDGDPLGTPVVKASPRWSWVDGLNRIWKALWNIPDAVSWNGGGPYPFGTGDWDLFIPGDPDALPTPIPDANGEAWDRIEGLDGWWNINPSDTDPSSLAKIVCSPGPHLFTRLVDGRPDISAGNYARAYRDVVGVFSADQHPFTLYFGLFTPTVIDAGDGVAHISTGSAPNDIKVHTITYEDIPSGAGMYGYCEVEYTYTGAGDPTDPAGSGKGLYFRDPPSSVTGIFDTLLDGNKYYMWITDGSSGRGSNTIMSTAGAGTPSGTSGTQDILHWVDQADWVFTKLTFRGGIYTDSKDSTDPVGVGLFGGQAIHPRNYSVKAALHVTTEANLIDSDILDFDSLDGLLSVPGSGTRVVDTNLRAMFTQDTKDALDDYPTPTADPTTARAYLLEELNRLIDGEMNTTLYDLWLAAVEATITLRPGTQWMLERDSQDPAFLEKLRRRLLEDCYTTQLNRIPTGYTDPEDEIAEIAVDTDVEGVATWNVTHPLVSGSVFCSEEDCEIIYIGLGLPQWCSNSALWRQMPDVRGVDSYTTGAKGYVPATARHGLFRPALTTIPSNYPIFHKDWFGVLTQANNQDEWVGKNVNAYLPYWRHDTQRAWTTYPAHFAIAAGAVSYDAAEVAIDIGFAEKGRKLEYSLNNTNLTIYVSRVDYPDPTDPGTYEYSSDRGYFKFPDDFLTPETAEGGALWVTVKNNTSTSQSWQVNISIFTPDDQPWNGTDEPDPAPRFFPIQEPYSSQYGSLNATDKIFGDSVRFGPIEDIFGEYASPVWPVAYPCPQRGQHVREILIRRKPVRNSAGIYVEPDTEDMEEKDILIGVMAGAGVISGAIYGSYPGDWCSLGLTQDTYTIPAGENELRVAVSYFVLKGCPLAYYVKDADGNEDDEEFDIFCSVEFQPQVNNTFVGTGVTLKESDIGYYNHLEGGWYGQPFVSNTYLWGDNINDYTPPQDVRHGEHKIIQPPLSVRVVKQVYDFLYAINNP